MAMTTTEMTTMEMTMETTTTQMMTMKTTTTEIATKCCKRSACNQQVSVFCARGRVQWYGCCRVGGR